MPPQRRFSAGDVDRVKPWALTREQTIDLMERRQEAAVMRYVREISQLSDHQTWSLQMPRKRRRECDRGSGGSNGSGPRGMAAKSETGGSRPEAAKTGVVEFSKMNTTQIASVMQGEQAAIESRLENTVAFLRAEKRRRCLPPVVSGKERAESIW